jgi:SAM-dependent methyltransferase
VRRSGVDSSPTPVVMPRSNGRWSHVELQPYPCDFCGSAAARTVHSKRGRLVQETFSIVRCRSCGHVRVSPRLTDAHIPDLYDDDYYHGRGFDRTVDYSRAAQTDYRNSAIVHAIIETVAQAVSPGARTLDVGCGLGDLVLGMRDRGFESYGTDSAPYAQHILDQRNVPTLRDIETEPQKYQATFDLVTCIEVIEHVTSPTEFLAHVKEWLRPGGLLFVLTGNWNVERFVPGTPYVMPEGHIHYFTPPMLKAFFEKAGLEPYYVPVNYVWFINRRAPQKTPRFVRRMLQSVFATFLPGYAPLPLARRPFR